MTGSKATFERLLALLQEASDLAKAATLPDGMSRVGPILAIMVQDLRDPVIRPSQGAKQKGPRVSPGTFGYPSTSVTAYHPLFGGRQRLQAR